MDVDLLFGVFSLKQPVVLSWSFPYMASIFFAKVSDGYYTLDELRGYVGLR